MQFTSVMLAVGPAIDWQALRSALSSTDSGRFLTQSRSGLMKISGFFSLACFDRIISSRIAWSFADSSAAAAVPSLITG